MTQQFTDSYDVVVTGAGMAGIVVAAKIAAGGVNPRTGGRLRIALIERGPYLKGAPRPGYGHPVRRRMFTNITTEFREGGRYVMGVPQGPGGRTSLPIPAASIVGGGSLHYGAETRDPHSVDYLAWQAETGVDWSEANMKGAAQEIVRMFNIHERPRQLLDEFSLGFGQAGRDLGYEVSPTPVAKQNCLLSGFCDSINMCKYDARGGSFVAYLPIAEKNGVDIIPEAEVQRVILEKGRATGVEFIQEGTTKVLRAEKVVVSCGIFGSPVLLMRSGYGSRDELGRDLLVENSNVGRNIDTRPGPGTSHIGVFDAAMSDGEFHDGGFHLFHDTQPNRQFERIQFRNSPPLVGQPHQVALHDVAPEFGRKHKNFMSQICNPAVPSAHRDEVLKRGRMTIAVVRPAGVFGRTNIKAELSYQVNHPRIQKVLEEGNQIAEKVLRAMNAKEVIRNDRPISSRRFFAWAGSCRAGTDSGTSVVNQYGESHDVENLLVCDASIMPRCASQGYGAPTATVAAFISERIVARHFTKSEA
ncbi:MAG: GMC family oxidoreductase [Gammaproteobacteria bacterium]